MEIIISSLCECDLLILSIFRNGPIFKGQRRSFPYLGPLHPRLHRFDRSVIDSFIHFLPFKIGLVDLLSACEFPLKVFSFLLPVFSRSDNFHFDCHLFLPILQSFSSRFHHLSLFPTSELLLRGGSEL